MNHYKIISNLKNKFSSGYDDISNFLLKKLVDSIKVPLCHLFNKSLSDGIFPDLMKIAEVVPLYKPNNCKSSLNSYRPISLLPVISKVLEKVVYKRVYTFLTKNNLLYMSQYGFREGHSTINAVTEFFGKVIKGFDKSEYTLGIFLDLSRHLIQYLTTFY